MCSVISGLATELPMLRRTALKRLEAFRRFSMFYVFHLALASRTSLHAALHSMQNPLAALTSHVKHMY
jgi:hypothetical protein